MVRFDASAALDFNAVASAADVFAKVAFFSFFLFRAQALHLPYTFRAKCSVLNAENFLVLR